MEPGHPDLELDFLATVFDVARIGICVIDEAGLFVRVNPAFCALVEYSTSELVGQSYAMCAPPSVVEVKERFLGAILDDSPKIPKEWKIRRKDQTLFDALVSFRPITRADGGRYAVVTFSDITDSKLAQAEIQALNRDLEQRIAERTAELTDKVDALTAAEEALRESEERTRRTNQRLLLHQAELAQSEQKYRRVIDLAREGFWLLNARNETVEVNAALCEMLGFRPEELLGGSSMDFADESSQVVLRQRLVARPQPPEATYEVVLKRKDGGRIHTVFNAVALMNQQGERELSFAFVTDITQRKLLEQELRRTLSEREAILQTSVVGIAFVRNRHFVWVNQAFERDMLGFEAGELPGQSVGVTYPSREAFERLGPQINAILAAQGVFHTESQVRRKDGGMLWCQVSGRAIDRHDLSLGSIWTIADISRRKQAEAEVLQALDREKELSEMKSRFVSMTSHEFRTPLAAIMSSIELLSDYGERLPASEKAELTGVIKSSVRRMTQMLEDVLLIGRADAGRLEFDPQPIDLRHLCSELVDEARSGTDRRHDITLSWSGAEGPRNLDEKLLRHILSNLLTNAVKYSPGGGRIELAVACSRRDVVLAVSDQGIGIALEDQPRLFQTFQRGRNVGNISGTGLGLAIVKKAVDLQGGSISVDSTAGKGSRFSVRLPAPGSLTDA